MKPKPLKENMIQFEIKGIKAALKTTKGNVAGAARVAGYPERSFWNKIHEYEIDPGKYRK